MLTELVVEGLGVIERAELALERGSIALTGETGAGKTLVVAAVGLLLGGRADRALVRSGAREARVEGRFVIPADHPAALLLEARGLIPQPGEAEVEVVMSRSVGADGRGRARVNGRLATVGLLSEVGPLLVEIAGQHEHQRIGAAPWQRAVLDHFAGPDAVELGGLVAESVRLAARARRRLEELRSGERARSRALDVLRYEIEEIEAAKPAPGESERLAAEAARLDRAEVLAAGVGGALEALVGERGAEDGLSVARRALSSIDEEEICELAGRLDSAAAELDDIAASLSAALVAPDPAALEETRSRIAQLASLKRKYGDDESEILAYLDGARRRADELAGEDNDAGAHEEALAHHLEVARRAASELSASRKTAAPRLEGAIEQRLEELALPGARFTVRLAERDLYEGGAESVEFLVAANPGEPPAPVARVASGGELSRIALALHLLTATDFVTTMIFDEVDAGVGGQAARAVGRALVELTRARGGQAIVVTHLPQVAAQADVHLRVLKSADPRMSATVEKVEGNARVEELSRMLAGLPESERAKQHAQELLAMASESRG